MNTPNKITISRIILSFIIIIILLIPFESMNIHFPRVLINELIVVDIKYIIAGLLFIIAGITDFVDGRVARKKNQVTDFGKMLDAIADKVLVDSVLIILATSGFISPVIPVIIVVRDCIVDSIKMISASKGQVVAAIKTGKIKTACLMTGIVLSLFYNLPFELANLKISTALLTIACILSIVSGFEYYYQNKKNILE